MAEETTTPKPDWLEALLSDYRAGVTSTFVLYGAVFDYVDHPSRSLTVRDYLALTFAKQYTTVVYSPDEGVTFIAPPKEAAEFKQRFLRVTGLGGGQVSEAQQYLRAQEGGGGDAALPTTPTGALPKIVQFLQNANKDDGSGRVGAAIIDRLDLIAPRSDKGVLPDPRLALLSLLHRVGTDPEIDAKGALMVLLTPTLEEIHPDLRMASSNIRFIEIEPPSYGQRLDFLTRVCAEKELTLEMPEGELAAQTAGLLRRHLEDISLRAKVANRTVTRALVTERKKQQLASEYAEVLEVLDPQFDLEDVGGHTLAKEYLLDWVVPAFEDDELRDQAPTGIMFLGPPGTGKTLISSALAKRIGLNCVLLRADKIRGGIVGESERKLAKALQGIRALAPCLVFIDEIDQKFRRISGGSDGGSAVEANIFSRLLEFFSEPANRGVILPVAASNRPDLVDAALMRAGRFDVKIPLLAPADAEERAAVIETLLKRYRLPLENGIALTISEVARSTNLWTQAELERLVVMAKGIARIKKVAVSEALLQARARLKSSTRSIEEQTKLALGECDDLALVPDEWQAYVGDRPMPSTRSIDPEIGRGRTTRENLDF